MFMWLIMTMLVSSHALELAERCLSITPYRVDHDLRERYECAAAELLQASAGANAHLLLRRRNDVVMYGKCHSEYPHPATPEYALLRLFDDAAASATNHEPLPDGSTLAPAPLLWDATLVVRPKQESAVSDDGSPCFLAMNRFPVRADAAALFEERWARRSSMLPYQPGMLGFSLLRRRADLGAGEEPYTYSTATLWASQEAWSAWREGAGRDAHATSRTSNRVPLSEWMEGPASPIFFDVPIYVHPSRGIVHVACATADDGGSLVNSGRRPRSAPARMAVCADADCAYAADCADDGLMVSRRRLPLCLGRTAAGLVAAALLVPRASAAETPPPAYGDEGESFFITPTDDLRFILEAGAQLDEVARKLAQSSYTPSDDDRVAVLQLLSFSWKPTSKLVAKMSERFGALRALRAVDRAKASEIASAYAASVAAVEQACRERAPPQEQVAALRAASASLADFITVCATKFEIPKLAAATAALL